MMFVFNDGDASKWMISWSKDGVNIRLTKNVMIEGWSFSNHKTLW